jgi:hypothetical protein
MKKVIISSALTAILTAVVISIAQDKGPSSFHPTQEEHIQQSPSPKGVVDRYEIIAAKVTNEKVGKDAYTSEEVSYVIRLDKFTGRAWYFSVLFDAQENKTYDNWKPIKY